MPRIAAILSPVADWGAVREAAVEADHAGLDAIGLWDHYHSGRPEWAYVAGWNALGALAAATQHVRLVPMVLNNLHYQLGVLAKESSVLAAVSGGRFELGIGAGDWPESFAAWGESFPPRDERLGRLEETVRALGELWRGEPLTLDGTWLHLAEAISTPAPPERPRVVIGVGKSVETARRLAPLADELNVYLEPAAIHGAREAAADAGHPVAISGFVDWSWDRWPVDVGARVAEHAAAGIDRLFVSLGSDEMAQRIATLGQLTPSALARA